MTSGNSMETQSEQGLAGDQELVCHPTGIKKLDDILSGGFPEQHIILVAGDSGTGKTTLSTEWLIRGARQHNKNSIYFTLTESVTDATRNLHTFNFATENVNKVSFVDLRSTLKLLGMNDQDWDMEDIDTFVESFGTILDDNDADRVVIDSITALAYALDDRQHIRRLIFRLGNVLKTHGVTALLTSEVSSDQYSRYQVEEFISDGIIQLKHDQRGDHLARTLQVVKMRGIDYNAKVYNFEITHDGINLFYNNPDMTYEAGDTRLKTGIPELDQMIDGGVWKNSANLISGPAGSGKTTMGLHFIDQCLKEDRNCLYVSFEESQSEIMKKANQFGIDLDPDDDGLTLLSIDPKSGYPDQHLEHIRNHAMEDDLDVVVLDSLTAIRHTTDENTFERFTKDLVFALKREEVTSFYTSSYQNLIGIDSMSESGISSFADNVFMQNIVEVEGKLESTIAIWKVRNSDHDPRIRRYEIGETGISIGKPMRDYHGIATGAAETTDKTVSDKIREEFRYYLPSDADTQFNQVLQEGMNQENIIDFIDKQVQEGVLGEGDAATFKKRCNSLLRDELIEGHDE